MTGYIPSIDEMYPSGLRAQNYEGETVGPKCPKCGSYDTWDLPEGVSWMVCEDCGHKWLEVIPF